MIIWCRTKEDYIKAERMMLWMLAFYVISNIALFVCALWL